MGWVQGGARAAFATPSWGPARIFFLKILKKIFLNLNPCLNKSSMLLKAKMKRKS